MKKMACAALALLLTFVCTGMALAESAVSITTGLPTTEPARIMVVQMDNEPKARPQKGIASADVVYEIELYNGGGESVSLEGWYLSDKTEEPNRWRFPAASIAPGEYLVVYASGKDRGGKYLHTNFSLSTGETVILSTPVGTTVCAVECPLLEADHAWALRGDGTYGETAMPTPGSANG